ncbi:MAG TPA: FtsX-like permease family protein [Spirochaetales bacterium]|nr:FtsX-like permease family protein [Spirochaetales bacterium]HQG39466.1 FtsX-like permease family protein [Spirochaetales bacterium]HQK33573.1 FtsX-like permease family protein [Spirochaetales bacterium]
MFRFISQLAWKNLMRYKRRTLITALAIAMGIGMYIGVDSMLKSAEQESERNLHDFETGSGVITTKAYWDSKERIPTSEYIEHSNVLLQSLSDAGLQAAPRIQAQGELIVYEDPYPVDGSMRVILTGIDPVRDEKVFKLQKTLSKGRFLKEQNPEVILGSWIAEKLNADVGYPITIVTRTVNGYMQTIDATVVGIIDAPDPVINRTGVYLPLEYLQEMLEMPQGATHIFINFNMSNVNKNEQKINEILLNQPMLMYHSWEKLAEDYLAIAGAKQKGTSFILLLVFIIAAVGISNTMLMAVYERMRELGMLRAMGMEDEDIKNLFFIEAGLIGIIGAVFGVVLGIAFDFYLVTYGFDFSMFLKDIDIGYRVGGAFHGIWNITTMISCFFIGAVIAVLVSIFPVRRGLKKTIVECLRK